MALRRKKYGESLVVEYSSVFCVAGREQEAGECDREARGSHTEGEGDPSEERGK